ncbi:Uncharacterised protein [Mycobacteroides abscessus subsp. massiliense]|nr:Uncharacterised protein [Mycobacteroides abscessus subsp. massiliense]
MAHTQWTGYVLLDECGQCLPADLLHHLTQQHRIGVAVLVALPWDEIGRLRKGIVEQLMGAVLAAGIGLQVPAEGQ